MFDNIASLRFIKGPNSEMIAMAMISGEGEVMEYRNPITADGRVEDWMTNVLNEMRKTNRLITKEAVFFYCSSGITRYILYLVRPSVSFLQLPYREQNT